MKNYLVFLVFIGFSLQGKTQSNLEQEAKIDSLKRVIELAQHDSIVVKAMYAWDDLIYRTHPELDLELNLAIDSIVSANLDRKISDQEKQFFLEHKSYATGNLGLIYNARGENSTALKYLFEAVEVRRVLNNKKAIAYALNNIGAIYNEQGMHDKAIEYYTKSLVAHEEIDNTRGIGGALNNIAIIHKSQGNYNSAINFYEKSLQLKIENKDSTAIAVGYLNIGALYLELEKYDTASNYFINSLELSEATNDSSNIARAFVNLGAVYHEQNELDRALDYYLKGYQIQIKRNDQKVLAETAVFLGSIYYDLGDIKQAEEFAQKALQLSFDNDVLQVSEEASNLLYRIYKKQKKSTKSLEMLELYISLNDSINSEKNQKEVIRQQYKYEYEKQAAADSIKSAEEAKLKDAQLLAEQVKREKQEQQSYYLFATLGLAILFGGFIFNRFRVTNKQKNIIEKQKEKVDTAYEQLEEKNKEVLDSINYAKRIQGAILPPAKLVNQYLKDAFILYKPKAVVAGDFYWLEPVNGSILYAAADCTGHGVPGAMVSVVCNNSLNRSVREFGLTDPAQILNKTRELVIQEFEKSEDEVKDGMDIALCSLRLRSDYNEQIEKSKGESNRGLSGVETQQEQGNDTPNRGLSGVEVHFAGAHNPLWIIRKGASEVEEIKADKQPIGKYADPKAFTTHSINLQPGDTLYTFSDGFVDQFGGPKGKKFKAKNFKSLLLSVQSESMERQKKLIDEAFENWRGNLEQLDDVCVIGVRV